MRFFHPESTASRRSRDDLLQRALREAGTPYPIASEYPLVLSESGSKTSFCLGAAADGPVLAHANLWERELVDERTGRRVRIGLIGNVATDAAHRGQGLMRRLLEGLKSRATESGLAALVLWSDLLEFYQKQEFQSYGRETRYLFRTDRLPAHGVWTPPAAGSTEGPGGEELLRTLLANRLRLPATLARSAQEFATLLTIPGMEFLVDETTAGYVIMGKGADMLGVIHEWSARTPETLLGGVRTAATRQGYEACMLLTPESLPRVWRDAIGRYADRAESHPMALMWIPEGTDETTRAVLASGFVWGLDSI